MSTSTDEIKRTTPPQTRNGTQWEVQLCATPTREWLELFKLAGEASPTVGPQRVIFDRDALSFKSDEERVEQWIQSIDKWIAATNARHAMQIESASRERAVREGAETRERERITQLNERFKNL